MPLGSPLHECRDRTHIQSRIDYYESMDEPPDDFEEMVEMIYRDKALEYLHILLKDPTTRLEGIARIDNVRREPKRVREP